LQAINGAGENANGCFGGRGRGMTTGGFNAEFERQVALFSDSNGGSATGKTRKDTFQHIGTLIQNSMEADVLLLETGNDAAGTKTEHFFIMAECKKYRP